MRWKLIGQRFLLVAAGILSCNATTASAQETLVPVEDLIAVGFSRSRVVMINEGHSDLRRCKRCRMVGRLVLPRAHAAGVRHFAVEALTPEFADAANRDRRLPVGASEGFLAQSDMRALLQAALDLGWTLISYEAPLEELEGKDARSAKAINWREDRQAQNLVAALAELPVAAKLLVWCGNSHLRKVEAQIEGGHTWRPMARQFWKRSGIEPFSISQTVSVDFSGTGRGASAWAMYEEQLKASPIGTLGFLTDEESGFPGIDAVVVSLDNELR